MKLNGQSLFWIEPSALTGLLDAVGGSVATPPSRLSRAEARSVAGPMVRSSTDDVEAVPAVRARLVLPQRPFEARLAALLGWLECAAAFEQAFVIDADGLPLVQETASHAPVSGGTTVAELIAASAALGRTWQALRRSGELEERTSVALELGSSRRLYLLAAETRWGLLQLGFVTERLLGRADLDAARDAFHRTVDEKEHDRS